MKSTLANNVLSSLATYDATKARLMAKAIDDNFRCAPGFPGLPGTAHAIKASLNQFADELESTVLSEIKRRDGLEGADHDVQCVRDLGGPSDNAAPAS